MTTTVTGLLCWRDLHPLEWQLASLHQNHLTDIVAIDMFVVATATFRLLYALIVLGHGRRRVIRFNVTQYPIQAWRSRQLTEAFPWDTPPRYLLRDRDVLGLRKPNAKQLELTCASSLAPASKLYIGNPYQACLLEWWF
jgi:putative transposase